jgi:hypothetical protein
MTTSLLMFLARHPNDGGLLPLQTLSVIEWIHRNYSAQVQILARKLSIDAIAA